ncbi:unnamed protein product, partial [Amoebophrya sp. A25]
ACDTDPPRGLTLNSRAGVVFSVTKTSLLRHSRHNPLHTDVVWSSSAEPGVQITATAISNDGLAVVGTSTGRLLFIRSNNGYMARRYVGVGEKQKRGGTFALDPPEQLPEPAPATKAARRKELNLDGTIAGLGSDAEGDSDGHHGADDVEMNSSPRLPDTP